MRRVVLLAGLALVLSILGPAAAQQDGPADTDHDGLTDAEESEIGTDPNNPDTDEDGLVDGFEHRLDLSPTLFAAPDELRALWDERAVAQRARRDADPRFPGVSWDSLWDVKSYDLSAPLSAEAWNQYGRAIDIAGVTATVASAGPQSGLANVPAVPGEPSAPEEGPCSPIWTRIIPVGGGWTYGPGDIATWAVAPISAESVIFGANDGRSLLEVAGSSLWKITFHEDRIDVEIDDDLLLRFAPLVVTYRDECGGQVITRVVEIRSSGVHTIRLGGVNASITLDADGGLETVLTEGSFSVDGSALEPLRVDPESDQPLLIAIDSDGAINAHEVTLDAALQRFPPAARSLTYHFHMVDPIPADLAGVDLMAWVVMLDLDGDPATGMTAQSTSNAMYAGLGADAYIPVYLQPDGTLAGDIVFHDGQAELGSFPVDVMVSGDRYTASVHVPTEALARAVESAGAVFDVKAMHWRVATVYHGPAGDAKDVYPEPGPSGQPE